MVCVCVRLCACMSVYNCACEWCVSVCVSAYVYCSLERLAFSPTAHVALPHTQSLINWNGSLGSF